MGGVQTSYSYQAPLGIAGAPATNRNLSRVAKIVSIAAIAAGFACFAGVNASRTRTPAAAAVADADGIITTKATAASQQVSSGVDLNGAVGGAQMFPPRRVTMTLNSHADWNATTAVIAGENEDGAVISENLTIPDAGNAVLTTVQFFSKVTSVTVPAQGGTNGSYTVGFGSDLGPCDRQFQGVSLYTPAREPGEYPTASEISLADEGDVWVTSETAVTAGDPVYVRFTAGDGESLGAFRATPDSTDCARLKGARWASTRSDAGLAILRLRAPAMV
jgi:hypothetical protein